MTDPGGDAAPPVEVDANLLLPLIARRKEARAARDGWVEIIDKLENEITSLLGRSDVATIGGQPVVRFPFVAPRETIDAKALRAKYPEIADEFTKLGKPYRRLTITEPTT